jgi:hypothetical protein
VVRHKTEEEFHELLTESRKTVRFIVKWLNSIGHKVLFMENEDCPIGKKHLRWDYVDLGDVEITQRIEVKQKLKVDWDSLKSFPFPDVIIDEPYKLFKTDKHGVPFPKHLTANKKELSLHSYIIVNKSKTGCLVFSGKDVLKRDGREAIVFDDRERAEVEYYFAPIKYAKHCRIK